jgi:hypothetical protein
MTDDEWAAIEAILQDCWPGEFDERAGLAWRAMLGDEDPISVLRAFKSLALSADDAFRPSVNEVLREVHHREGLGASRAYDVLYARPGGIAYAQVRSDKAFWEPGERETANRELRRDLVAAAEPKIQAFVAEEGLDHIVLDRPVHDDADGHNGARRHRFDEAWAAFSDRYDRGEARMIAAGRRNELDGRGGLRRIGA